MKTHDSNFIRKLPKCELHLHIEGTLEPEMMFALAERNKVRLKYRNVDEVRSAYNFTDLQSFLDVYYEGASVLRKEEDFYDLMFAYLKKASSQGVRHAEIFFDAQTHTDRGISYDTVIRGISAASTDARKEFGISSDLILSFLRHLTEAQAIDTFKQALPHKKRIIGVGLDSSEKGHPPEKFRTVYAQARKQGLKCVAHAGEEGPPSYVWGALNELKVKRIDHGVRSLEDPALVKMLAKKRIPLTVCPLSNVKLGVFPNLKKHTLKKMLELGLLATINSDDPAYFGGYIYENFVETQKALKLSRAEIVQLARNSFEASFLSTSMKKKYLREIDKMAGEI
ncbi:MAG TPA: adenosine deaminase [Bacteroidota bacterium]|nr:adenosine deaminase [Bacteroidota bacterium]